MRVFDTERLKLRLMTEDDVDNLQQIFSDPVAMQYYPSTKNLEETISWIRWTLNNYESHGVGLWVVERKDDEEFLGQCGIVPQNVNHSMEYEIGYLFVRQFWGNGYATEAAVACRDWGFDNLNPARLISLIDPRNKPSQGVAIRNGMSLHEHIVRRDKPVDVWAIARSEWNSQKSSY